MRLVPMAWWAAASRIARHQGLNYNIVRLSQPQAHLSTKNHANGLPRPDGTGPDCLTLVPRAQGKPLTWDVTVICTYVPKYIAAASQTASSDAELAAARISLSQ